MLNFNEKELKLYNSYERKVRDYVIVRIKDIDSLKKGKGLYKRIFSFFLDYHQEMPII